MKEILIKGQLHKFQTFQAFAEEFQLGARICSSPMNSSTRPS